MQRSEPMIHTRVERNQKRALRRQLLTNLFLLLLVLGLGAVCAVAYCHARGGFIR